MKKAVLITLLFLFLIPISAQAAGLVPCGGPNEPACTLCDFFIMLNRIISFLLFRIIPVLGALMIAIGGGMYILSQADPEMLSRVKRLFTAIAIGLVIIYGAWGLVNLFLKIIGATIAPDWWIINCR